MGADLVHHNTHWIGRYGQNNVYGHLKVDLEGKLDGATWNRYNFSKALWGLEVLHAPEANKKKSN